MKEWLFERGIELSKYNHIDAVLLLMAIEEENMIIWKYFGRNAEKKNILSVIDSPYMTEEAFKSLVYGADFSSRPEIVEDLIEKSEQYDYRTVGEEQHYPDETLKIIMLKTPVPELVPLYETSKQHRRLLQSPKFLKDLALENGLYNAKNFSDLVEQYDRTNYTSRCMLYHPTIYCLENSLKNNDIKTFNKIWVFVSTLSEDALAAGV